MSRLKLALLGAPVITHGEREILFPTRKALALLIYLAVEKTAHSRDKITALFWSESDAEQGRASLRGTLAYIRQSLRGAIENTGEANHLITDRESLRLDADSDFELDLDALDDAVKAARQIRYAAQPPEPGPRLEQLGAAAQHVRGEFLEGFSLSDSPGFDDWVSLQRELWHRRASEVLDVLSQGQFEGGELTLARETTTRWTAFDAFNETAQRRLMEIHLSLGDRAAALVVFEAYRAFLARELNAEPSPETQSLAERARVQIVPAPSIHETELASESEVALVGRRTEHLKLVNVFRTVRRGHTHIVLVQGEPGIGKTRLVREFLAWAFAQGAIVLRGRAFETIAQLPYQPFSAALRAYVASCEKLEPLLTRTWWAELSRLLPEIQDRLPGLSVPAGMNEAEARTRLFEAVTRLVLALAARTPVVLFIDDVPWADVSSLDLLAYAVRRWHQEHTPVMVVCTARSEDLVMARDAQSAPPLEQWFVNFAREVPLMRLGLEGLDADATAQMIYAFGVDSQSADTHMFTARVFDETGGQPFFVLEVLKAFTENGLIQLGAGGKWSLGIERVAPETLAGTNTFLPPSLRELIHARLARLSLHAQELCNAGAVLGDGFTLPLVARVGALSETEALLALEETWQRGLVREVGDRYFFAHDKIRQTVYADTGQARRRELHRRALEILEGKGAPPAERAHHAFAAGLNERASILFGAAGDAAMQLFAVRSAIGYYERALSLGAAEPGVREKLGRAYEFVNDWTRAREAYEPLLWLARETHNAETESVALNRLATVAAQGFFDLPLALKLLGQALEASERSGQDTRRAETEWSLSQIFFYIWELDRSRDHAERALALARRLDNTDLTARSLNILTYISAVSYDPMAEVEAAANESRALFAKLGNRAMEVECLAIVAIARVFSGLANETLEVGREGYAIAREIENPWGQANCAYPMVFALIELGKAREALELAQDGLDAARAAGHPPILVFNLSAVGRAFRAIGDFASARRAHSEAHAIAEALHHPFVGALAALDLCADFAVASEWQAAYPYARAALALRKYERLYPGFTFALETETLVRAGEADAAEADARQYGAHIRDNPRAQMQYQFALAVLEKARGNLSAAAGHQRAAHSIGTALGLPGRIAI